jgi:hypothetical protein
MSLWNLPIKLAILIYLFIFFLRKMRRPTLSSNESNLKMKNNITAQTQTQVHSSSQETLIYEDLQKLSPDSLKLLLGELKQELEATKEANLKQSSALREE